MNNTLKTTLKKLGAVYSNSRLLWPLKIIITALVIYLVNKSIGKNQIPEIFHRMAFGPVMVSLVLGCAGLYCQIKQWQLLLRNQEIAVDFKTGLRTMLFGNLLAFVTPGRSGDFFRGISISVKNKTDPVYAVLVEKIYGTATIILAGALAALVSREALGAGILPEQTMLVGCAVVLALAAGFAVLWKPFAVAFFGLFRALLHEKAPTSPSASFTKKNAGIQMFLSAAIHSVLLTQTAVLLDMFGSGHFFANIAVAAQAYAFMLFVPIFIANMGIREYSFGIFLGQFSKAYRETAQVSSIAFGASMGILCINIMLPALAGLIWWLAERKRPA
jgi:hypothetical protein